MMTSELQPAVLQQLALVSVSITETVIPNYLCMIGYWPEMEIHLNDVCHLAGI